MSHCHRQFKWYRCFSGSPHHPHNPWFQSTEYSSPTSLLALMMKQCVGSAADIAGSGQACYGLSRSRELACPTNPSTAVPISRSKLPQIAYVCGIFKVVEKTSGAEARDEETVPAAAETTRRSNCLSCGVPQALTEWHFQPVLSSAARVLADSFGQSLAPEVFCLVPFSFPAQCLSLLLYPHSFPLLPAKGHGKLPPWGFFYTTQWF